MFNLMPWKKQKENNLTEFRKEFDQLLNRFWDNDYLPTLESSFEKSWFPKVDVSENEKEVIVKAEIPGVDSKDIDVSLDGRMLTIKGEKKQEKEEKDKNYHRIERSYGYYNRTLELPAEVDEKDIDASYKKGVLKVTMKKTKESSSRKIEIKTK